MKYYEEDWALHVLGKAYYTIATCILYCMDVNLVLGKAYYTIATCILYCMDVNLC